MPRNQSAARTVDRTDIIGRSGFRGAYWWATTPKQTTDGKARPAGTGRASDSNTAVIGDGANDRLLQGTIIRCVDGHWSDRDGVVFTPDTQMIVLGTTQALQRWQDQTPIETILKKPGERLPDAKAAAEADNE
jgi:hypothetical protein